jgi:translocation and assembly module TamB
MKRHVRLFGHGFGTTAVFALAVGGGVLMHLDRPLVRRVLVSRVNAALGPAFEGKITIERVDAIGASGIAGADVHVEDGSGRRVLRVEGLRAHLDTLALLRSLFAGGDITIGVTDVSIGRAEVDLEADESGGLRLAKAFVPRRTAETAPAAGRGVRLSMPAARLAHATVKGTPAGGQPIDADVDDLEASLSVVPGKLELRLPHAAVVARGLAGGATARGSLAGSFAQPSSRGGDRSAEVSWQGTVGGIAESLHATYDGGAIDAALDVPEARPEDLRAMWPASPLTETAEVHLGARGTLPDLLVIGQLRAGRGWVSLVGPVSVGAATRAALRFDARGIDASAFARAPGTTLGARGEALIATGRDGALGAVLALDADAGRVGAVPTPPITLVADVRKDNRATEGEASILVREAGAPTDIKLRLTPKGSSFSLAFDASTRVDALDGIKRVPPVARGHAVVDAHGSIDLGAQTVDGKLDLSALDVGVGSVHVGRATVAARANGPLRAPLVDADAHAGELDIAGMRFASLDVGSHGPPTRSSFKLALVGQDGRLDATTLLDLTDGTTLRNSRVDMNGRGEHVTATASLVRIGAAGARADDVRVDGLGAPLYATFSSSPGAVMLKAQTDGLELARVAHAAGLVRRIGGRVAIDVDAEIKWNAAQGRFALDVVDATVDGWEGAKVHLDATLHGRRVTGRASASLGDIASIDLQTKNAEIGGSGLLEPGWWRRAWGEVDVEGKVDLAKLAEKLPADGAGAANKVSGLLEVKAQLERDSATDDTPLLKLKAGTKDLVVTGGGTAAPWRFEGVDASFDLSADGENGHTAIDARLQDKAGLLADFNLSSDGVPYGRLFRTSDGVLDIAQDMPFTANLSIPERDIATLPSIVKTHGMHGQFKAGLEWAGSLLRPNLSATASLTKGRTDVRVLAIPLDLAVSAKYDGAHAHVSMGAQARAKQVLQADVDVDALAQDLLAATHGAPVPWKAGAQAKLDAFPLQSIGTLDDHQVRGLASGQFAISGLHDDAKANLALKVEGLRVGEVACKSAEANASVDGSAFDASIGITEQIGIAAVEDGAVELRAHAGSFWGSAMAPSLDVNRPADVSLKAKRFHAEVLQPFIASVFAQLGGRIDADARLAIDPVAKSVRPQGTIAFSEGSFELASFGGEFHDVGAKLVLTPDGIIRLENATMHGVTGRMNAAATARLDGLSLAGARAEFQIPKNDPLPLVLEGVQAGTLDGRFSLSVDRTPDRSGLEVGVAVPTLHLQLPTTSGHEVQALGNLEGVKVGVQHGNEFVAAQLDGDGEAPVKRPPSTPMKIAVNLGNDVQVARGSDLDVRLSGSPTITVADETRVTGQVRLVRGSLDVQGKPFSIENGTVTFVGDDASNPQVNITAMWTAPDETRVFADYIGPLKSAKLTLHSEPAYSETQILSLILFGTVDPDQQAPAGTGTGMTAQGNSAVGAAGGAATGPLNKALGGLNKALDNFGLVGGVVAKIDTSNTTPRPEVEVQIARDLSIQVALVLGLPPPGSNPDSTLVTLNWRFLRKWRLETTVGDAGTTILDLVWQHRY